MTQDTSDIFTNPEAAIAHSQAEIPQNDSTSTSQDETEQLRTEIAQLREQLARSQADYSNLVRRSREELSQAGEWSENKTILKFLVTLDNLERALEHTPEEFKSHTWTEGLTSIIRSMQKTVSDFGISRMNTLEQEVNPDLHEVISQVPHVSNTIQAEIEAWYTRGEKTLRHAKVIVGDGEIQA